jgi:drug/metabolite transporter (DMT)-like permease
VNKTVNDWLLFLLLSLIWGSSFILMKIGLDNHLSAYQVAALRVVSAGLVLFPIAISAFRKIPMAKLKYVFLSGVLGSLIPAFLFCIAEEEIDSSLAGILNCLTPIFVIVIGAFFFNTQTSRSKIIGVVIAFAGCVLLLISNGHMQESRHLLYLSLIVLATIFYAVNVNLVSRHLSAIPSLQIAAVALTLNAIPAGVILVVTGYFSLAFTNTAILVASGAAIVLGIVGTAIATIIFYALVKSAGGLFASMVTYGIPFVAIAWGVYYKESFSMVKIGCLLIILLGIYMANKKVNT